MNWKSVLGFMNRKGGKMKIVDIPEYTEEQLAHDEFLRLFSDQNNFSY